MRVQYTPVILREILRFLIRKLGGDAGVVCSAARTRLHLAPNTEF